MFGLIRTATIGAIALITAAGCKGPELFGPGDDESLPENHPPAVGPALTGFVHPTWAQNGHLAYVLPELRTAVSRADGTGPPRVLHTVEFPAQVSAVALSPDASQWYTVTSTDGMAVLRWHHDGITEVLTSNGTGGYMGNKRSHGVLVAANGDVAFVVRPDSLFLKRAAAAPRFVATGCRSLAAISPAGDGVICHHPEPFSSPLRFELDGTVSSVAVSESQAIVNDVRWTAQGIHLLYSRAFSGFAAERQSDPQSKYSTPPVEYPETSGFQAVLAADGRSFAYSNHFCAKTSGFFGCDKSQTLLYHVDLVGRTTKRVVVQTSYSDGVSLSLSPDGRRIAYALGGQLFVLQVQ